MIKIVSRPVIRIRFSIQRLHVFEFISNDVFVVPFSKSYGEDFQSLKKEKVEFIQIFIRKNLTNNVRHY